MAMPEHTVFEYLYRDTGNFKAWGTILLEGSLNAEDERELRECFVDGMFFDAERLGVPSLREVLWAASGSSYAGELDHGWHELSELRMATPDEVRENLLWGEVKKLILVARMDADRENEV